MSCDTRPRGMVYLIKFEQTFGRHKNAETQRYTRREVIKCDLVPHLVKLKKELTGQTWKNADELWLTCTDVTFTHIERLIELGEEQC